MEKVKILIIGAGVIGLSIAYELSKNYEDVVVIDKEETFGRHTSSRNSEVIHSGIYYPRNSLKAKFCLEGNSLLYQFAKENEIPFRNTKKIIVATKQSEIKEIEKLMGNGKINNVQGIEFLSQEECYKLEPQIRAIAGLYVPSTGIIDSHSLMKKLEYLIEENDAFVIYEMEVIKIECLNKGYRIHFSNGEIYETEILINSAGLNCEKISQKIGIDTLKNKLKIHWCKGEYFKSNSISGISHLIYPVPDPDGIFLGIHLSVNLNNEIRFGPNAYYVNSISYKMDDTYKQEFIKSVNQFMEISNKNIHADDTGIRPKLQGKGDKFRDFYIQEESPNGFPNFINLMGIESPGLTACLSIGKYVKQLCNNLN